MVVEKPITVTSSQFDHILSVAQLLAAEQREAYAVDVATSLQGRPIGDGSVGRAVREAFATHFIPPELPKAPSNWAAPDARPSKLRNGTPIEADRGPGGRPLKGR
jgi:hypothetical protein